MARKNTTKKEVSRDDRQEKCKGCSTWTSVNALTTVMEATATGKRSFVRYCYKCRG